MPLPRAREVRGPVLEGPLSALEIFLFETVDLGEVCVGVEGFVEDVAVREKERDDVLCKNVELMSPEVEVEVAVEVFSSRVFWKVGNSN